MNAQIHNVKDIYIENRENIFGKIGIETENWKSFARTIKITKENGEEIRLTLFSNDNNKLVLRTQEEEESLEEQAKEMV
jgi:hypothetical protein